jgi:CheY-like chemotaxis protein
MPTTGPIIIIEDDQDDQEILREVFDQLNLPNLRRFFTCSTEAFCYLLNTNEKPFLVICDINMPILNGFELREKINQNQCIRKKNIPFVFLSTNSEIDTIAKAYDLLARGYFVKPTKIADLTDMITKMIHYWKTSARPFP